MPEKKTDALILASPERKRILRELLSRTESWTAADRMLYHDICGQEWSDFKRHMEDMELAVLEKDYFAELVLKRVSPDRALGRAVELARETLKKGKLTDGQKERERRRLHREAVTSFRGAVAVTTCKWKEFLEACIVCGKTLPGGPIRRGGKRIDAAYCGAACRQKAYRRRRKCETK
jgi:hypothetical protein